MVLPRTCLTNSNRVGQNHICAWVQIGFNMCRVGQNHIYTVYIRYFWQGNHQIYGHIRCIYTVLANPKYVQAGVSVQVESTCQTLS